MVIARAAYSRAVPVMLFAGAVLLLVIVLASLRFANQTRRDSEDALQRRD